VYDTRIKVVRSFDTESTDEVRKEMVDVSGRSLRQGME
jgi:hypothetical protein